MTSMTTWRKDRWLESNGYREWDHQPWCKVPGSKPAISMKNVATEES